MLTDIFKESRKLGGERKKETNQDIAIFQAINLNIMGNDFWKNQSSYVCFTIEDRKLRDKIDLKIGVNIIKYGKGYFQGVPLP